MILLWRPVTIKKKKISSCSLCPSLWNMQPSCSPAKQPHGQSALLFSVCFLVAAFTFALSLRSHMFFISTQRSLDCYWLRTSSLIRPFIFNLWIGPRFQTLKAIGFPIWAVGHGPRVCCGGKNRGFEYEDLGVSQLCDPKQDFQPLWTSVSLLAK